MHKAPVYSFYNPYITSSSVGEKIFLAQEEVTQLNPEVKLDRETQPNPTNPTKRRMCAADFFGSSSSSKKPSSNSHKFFYQKSLHKPKQELSHGRTANVTSHMKNPHDLSDLKAQLANVVKAKHKNYSNEINNIFLTIKKLSDRGESEIEIKKALLTMLPYIQQKTILTTQTIENIFYVMGYLYDYSNNNESKTDITNVLLAMPHHINYYNVLYKRTTKPILSAIRKLSDNDESKTGITDVLLAVLSRIDDNNKIPFYILDACQVLRHIKNKDLEKALNNLNSHISTLDKEKFTPIFMAEVICSLHQLLEYEKAQGILQYFLDTWSLREEEQRGTDFFKEKSKIYGLLSDIKSWKTPSNGENNTHAKPNQLEEKIFELSGIKTENIEPNGLVSSKINLDLLSYPLANMCIDVSLRNIESRAKNTPLTVVFDERPQNLARTNKIQKEMEKRIQPLLQAGYAIKWDKNCVVLINSTINSRPFQRA